MNEKHEVLVPVGRQIVHLDERQVALVCQLQEHGDVEFIGLRVWIERRDGRLLLHLGELQVVAAP